MRNRSHVTHNFSSRTEIERLQVYKNTYDIKTVLRGRIWSTFVAINSILKKQNGQLISGWFNSIEDFYISDFDSKIICLTGVISL